MNLIPRSFFTNDLFDDFMSTKQNNMKCDIYEENNIYYIELDIPGFNKEDIKVEVNKKDSIIITAEKDYEKSEDKNYIHKERYYGKYQRSFYLENLDNDNINAEFINGVLKISIPKKEEVENKKYIDIK